MLVTKPSPQPLHPVILTLLHDCCHNVCQECQNLSTGISHLFPNHSTGEQITVHINLVLCYSAHLYTAQKGVSDPLRLELQAVINLPICPPTHLSLYIYMYISLQLSQPFDYKYSPSLATTQLPAGSIFLLPAQGCPPPIPQGLHYVQSWQDWTLERTVYLFPLAHLHLLVSRPKLFLWNPRHFDGPVYPVT